MINLAGREDASAIIHHELDRVGVPVYEAGDRADHPDVKTELGGKLGNLEFRRNWYYWVVSGPVPLELAEALYNHPVGKTDIRAGGDCACRPPKLWANYYDADGKQLTGDDEEGSEEALFKHMVAKGFVKQADYEKYRFVRIPGEKTLENYAPALRKLAARAEVDCFHIDSEPGLYIFVQSLKKNGIV